MKTGDGVQKFLKTKEDRDYRDVAKNMSEYNNKAMALFPKKKAAADDDGGDGDGEEAAPITNIEDLMQDSRLWQWAGIGFG